jgi:N-acetylmuramoyl-L-alanine amidase
MAGSEVIICGKGYDIGHPVVTYKDPNGFNGYLERCTHDPSRILPTHPAKNVGHVPNRYRRRRSMGRNKSLTRLRQVIRQFVLHLDGCRDAKMCFHVLHNERGLSAHFLVDNDGTIYQTLDVLECAFHAGGVNEISIGVEMQNRGDAARFPDYYKGARQKVTCRVHGHQFLAYDYTEPQKQAMFKLCGLMHRVFDLPLTSPMSNMEQVWTTIDEPRKFRGFIGHYHLARKKWDPGPWDFPRLFRNIGTRVSFPFSAPRELFDDRQNEAKQVQKFKRAAISYYDNSEQDVQIHFPVGPLGRSRLWHGGIHLASARGTTVKAVARGHIAAARFTEPTAVGSTNFVLLKHQLPLSGRDWTFFTLYYHLAPPPAAEDKTVPWLHRGRPDPWWVQLDRGDIITPNVVIEAGDVIGQVGEAGPINERSAQIHFATFSAKNFPKELDDDHWQLVDGGDGRRLCDDSNVIKPIDRRGRDGKLSRRELRNYFRFGTDRDHLHRMVAYHRSEWTEGRWLSQLHDAPDFAKLSLNRRQRLVAEQVEPTLWYTADLAIRLGLPENGMIYSYHPIGLLVWLRGQLAKGTGGKSSGIQAADKWEGKMAPKEFTVDAESPEEMLSEEDYHSGQKGKTLTLEDMVAGYPED